MMMISRKIAQQFQFMLNYPLEISSIWPPVIVPEFSMMYMLSSKQMLD